MYELVPYGIDDLHRVLPLCHFPLVIGVHDALLPDGDERSEVEHFLDVLVGQVGHPCFPLDTRARRVPERRNARVAGKLPGVGQAGEATGHLYQFRGDDLAETGYGGDDLRLPGELGIAVQQFFYFCFIALDGLFNCFHHRCGDGRRPFVVGTVHKTLFLFQRVAHRLEVPDRPVPVGEQQAELFGVRPRG